MELWLYWAVGLSSVVVWAALTLGLVDHVWHHRRIPNGCIAALVWDSLVSVGVRLVGIVPLTADPPDVVLPALLGQIDRINLLVCGIWGTLVLIRSRRSWDE